MTPTENSGNNSGRRGNLKNLKPFQPGQSGNPGGRPRKSKFTDMLIVMADELVPDDPMRRTWKRLLAEKIYLEASKGKIQAFTEILDRVEGKAIPRSDFALNPPEGDPKAKLKAFLLQLKAKHGANK